MTTPALWLLLATLTFPQDATIVRLDPERWPVEASEPARPLLAGESLWWWSRSCAPQKLRSGETPRCGSSRPIRVKIVDAKQETAGGTTVRWATEEMLADLPDDALPSAVTADDGTVPIAVPAASAVWIRVAGPRLASAWEEIPATADSVTIEATAGVVPRVRIRGEDGVEVERARVAWLPLTCANVCPERLLCVQGGKKTCTLGAAAKTSYRLVAWSNSHAPVTRTVTLASSGDVELTLPRGASAAVRLTDAAGKAVAPSALEVSFRLPVIRHFVRRDAAASADGVAWLGGLPVSPVEWIATAPGYARRVQEATLAPGLNDFGKVVLTPARRATVAVVETRAERPIAGANVVIRGVAAGTTDDKGRVILDELPQHDLPLSVRADGFLDADALLAKDESELRVTLDRGAAVKATLLREISGDAAYDARVRITNNGSKTLRTVTSARDFLISGLRPGTVRLVIAADDAQPYDTGSLDIADGETRDLGVIMLKTGRRVTGIVADDARAPVRGALVRVLRIDGDSPTLAHVLGNWSEARTADDGSFVLSGLSPGSQLLVVEAHGYARKVVTNVSLGDDGDAVDLGVVEMLPGQRVELVCRPGPRCGTEASLLLGGTEFPFLAIRAPLEDGRGSFDAAPPGATRLRLSRNQHVVHERAVAITREDGAQKIEVTLSSVRVHGEVIVGGKRARGGALLFQRVVHSDSVPIVVRTKSVHGSTLGTELVASLGAATRVDVQENGTFVTEELEPAEYDVTFRALGAATAAARMQVRDIAEQTITFRFEGDEVRGTVVDQNGAGTTARIQVTDASGTRHSARSGTDGAFAVLGLARGRARIEATAPGRAASSDVDTAKEESRNVVLRLSEHSARELLITVTDERGSPAPGVLVYVEAGGRMLIGSTDAKGLTTFEAGEERVYSVAGHRPGGAWAFGRAAVDAEARLTLTDRVGTLLVRTSDAGAVTLSTADGFPLDRVLSMVGISPQVAAGGTLRIGGLPAGTYDVGLGMVHRRAVVRPAQATVVTFGD